MNLAAFIGYRVAGFPGLLSASLGTTLPSFFVTLFIVALVLRFESHPVVARFFAGVRPAVLALIVVAVWNLAHAALVDKRAWGLAAVAFLLVLVFHLHPGVALAGGVVAGLLLFRSGACPVEPGRGEG